MATLLGLVTAKPYPNLIAIGHQTTEEVKHFTYLGSVVDNNGKVEADVNSRIGEASLTFQWLCSIWSMSTISLRPKVYLYNTLIIPIATYASETRHIPSRIAKSSMCFDRAVYIECWVSDTGEKVTNERNIAKEWAMHAWTHNEGGQDVAGRPYTAHAKPLPPKDNNQLDTTRKEEEE